MPSGWHGVDDEFLAALQDEDDRLQQPGLGVEAEAQFSVGPVVVLERLDPLRPVRRLDGASGRTPCLSALS